MKSFVFKGRPRRCVSSLVAEEGSALAGGRRKTTGQILGCFAGGIPDGYPPEGCDDLGFWTSRLVKLRCNLYHYVINAKDSWHFLLKWLEYTRKNPSFDFWIDLRGFLVGQYSYPHYTDFAEWGREIANLSRTYPRLTGFSIDDFCMPQPGQTQEVRNLAARPHELAKTMMQECWGINPEIQFFPVIYPCSIHLMESCQDCISGILYYCWTSGDSLAAAKRALTGKKIVAGIYAKVRGSEMLPQDVEKHMLTAKTFADGMMIFNVPENDANSPIGEVVARLFSQWNPKTREHM
jgi:hypothetical protein